MAQPVFPQWPYNTKLARFLKFWELTLIRCIQTWMAHLVVIECLQTQDGDYCWKTNTTFYLLGKLNLNLLLIQDIWSNRPNPAGHKVGSWIPQTKHLKKKHVCNEWVKYWYLWPSLFYQSVTIFMFRTICQHYHHYVSHKSKYSHNTWHKWWLEISTLGTIKIFIHFL